MSPDWIRILMIVISGTLNAIGFFGLFLVFFPGLTVSWLGHLIWVIWSYDRVICFKHPDHDCWIAY